MSKCFLVLLSQDSQEIEQRCRKILEKMDEVKFSSKKKTPTFCIRGVCPQGKKLLVEVLATQMVCDLTLRFSSLVYCL